MFSDVCRIAIFIELMLCKAAVLYAPAPGQGLWQLAALPKHACHAPAIALPVPYQGSLNVRPHNRAVRAI